MNIVLPADLPRRLNFCNWIVSLPDQELMQFLFSDEANFQLCGNVNSQNVRRYAPLKKSDPVNGGRPDHFFVEKRNFPKVMVFCGVKVVCRAVRPLPYLLSLIERVNFIRVYF